MGSLEPETNQKNRAEKTLPLLGALPVDMDQGTRYGGQQHTTRRASTRTDWHELALPGQREEERRGQMSGFGSAAAHRCRAEMDGLDSDVCPLSLSVFCCFRHKIWGQLSKY